MHNLVIGRSCWSSLAGCCTVQLKLFTANYKKKNNYYKVSENIIMITK